MKTIICTAGLAFTLALALPRPGVTQDPRLDRLSPDARPLVASLLDSARAAGLPAEPLVDRALEGASKRAPVLLIAAAVRRLAADLGRAREALGPGAAPTELTAGADALRAGAPLDVLVRLRDALGVRRLAVPLGVTADLTARGVPADTAASLVIALAREVGDAELLAFQRDVERDIALGVAPLAAAGGLLGLDAATPTSASGRLGETQTATPPARRKP